LTCIGPIRAGAFVKLMYQSVEKGRIDIRPSATTTSTPRSPKAPKIDDGLGQLVGRQLGSVSILCFHPKEPTTLAAWDDKGDIDLWDTEAKSKRVSHHLTTGGLRGTYAPDGRQIVTTGNNVVHLMNSRGDKISQGPTSHRILGVYYDGQLPSFWT